MGWGKGRLSGHPASCSAEINRRHKPGLQEVDWGWAVSLVIELVSSAGCSGPQGCA